MGEEETVEVIDQSSHHALDPGPVRCVANPSGLDTACNEIDHEEHVEACMPLRCPRLSGEEVQGCDRFPMRPKDSVQGNYQGRYGVGSMSFALRMLPTETPATRWQCLRNSPSIRLSPRTGSGKLVRIRAIGSQTSIMG